MNFEAGALAKAVANEGASAIPLLIGFNSISQLSTPLSNFQAHLSSKEDLKTVVHAVNHALGSSARNTNQLDAAFDKWWPDLEEAIHEAEVWAPGNVSVGRPSAEPPKMLEQILEAIRSLQVQLNTPSIFVQPELRRGGKLENPGKFHGDRSDGDEGG